MLEAITDENGDATFANVPIGTYEITEDGPGRDRSRLDIHR